MAGLHLKIPDNFMVFTLTASIILLIYHHKNLKKKPETNVKVKEVLNEFFEKWKS